MESKSDLLLASLRRYYQEDVSRQDTLREILGNKSAVSLRLLDWLATNYAKKHNILYLLPAPDGGPEVGFNMYLDYKSQLKAYSKRFFDPFCRRERTEFQGVHTTVGQLNFFRWAIEHRVVAYAKEHCEAIEADMMAAIRHRNVACLAEKPKRKELSKAAIKTATHTVVKLTVRFS